MSSLLAIDPGAAHPGPACAYFEAGVLRHVEFSYRPGGSGLTTIVVERLHFRGAVDVPRMPDLLRMMAAGYIAAGHALGQSGKGTLVELTPGEWKNGTPKPVCHSRLWSVLSTPERLALGGAATEDAIARAVDKGAESRWSGSGASYYPRSWKTHNLLDAVAIGCSYLGRIKR